MINNFDLNRLRAERIAKGLTQAEIAKKLGWSTAKYARRESGMVKLDINELAEMIEVMGYSVNDIGIFFKKCVHKTFTKSNAKMETS